MVSLVESLLCQWKKQIFGLQEPVILPMKVCENKTFVVSTVAGFNSKCQKKSRIIYSYSKKVYKM